MPQQPQQQVINRYGAQCRQRSRPLGNAQCRREYQHPQQKEERHHVSQNDCRDAHSLSDAHRNLLSGYEFPGTRRTYLDDFILRLAHTARLARTARCTSALRRNPHKDPSFGDAFHLAAMLNPLRHPQSPYLLVSGISRSWPNEQVDKRSTGGNW